MIGGERPKTSYGVRQLTPKTAVHVTGKRMARQSHATTSLVMYSCEAVSPFVLADRAAYGPDLMRIAEDILVPDVDRRRKDRLPLELKIYLLRSTDTHSIESHTINVNCQGFYCRVQEPFLTGECVRCTMAVPTVGRRRGCITSWWNARQRLYALSATKGNMG